MINRNQPKYNNIEELNKSISINNNNNIPIININHNRINSNIPDFKLINYSNFSLNPPSNESNNSYSHYNLLDYDKVNKINETSIYNVINQLTADGHKFDNSTNKLNLEKYPSNNDKCNINKNKSYYRKAASPHLKKQ